MSETTATGGLTAATLHSRRAQDPRHRGLGAGRVEPRARAARARRRRARAAAFHRARGQPGRPRLRARDRRRRSTVAACGARCATSTGCSTRPGGRRCACPRPSCTASTSTAPASCSRSACGRAWSAWSTPRRWPRSAPPGAGRRSTRRQVFDAGAYGIPYVNAKHEAEVQALRLAARGLPVVIVNPGVRVRARRHQPLVDRDRAPLPAPPDPGLRGRCPEHRRRRATSPAATWPPTSAASRASATSSATATTRSTASSPTSGGSPASSRRRVKLPLHVALAFAEAQARLPGRPLVTVAEVRAVEPVVDVPQHEGQARAGVAPVPARGHDRGHRRLVPGA